MPKKHAKTQTEQQNEEVFDFTKPDYKFNPGEYHQWIQQGPYLICKSCEIKHGTYIGMDKLLVGFDEKNQPILKKR